MAFSNKKSYRKKSKGGKRMKRRSRTKRGGKYHLPLNYFNSSYHKGNTRSKHRRCKKKSYNKLNLNNMLKSMRYKPKRSCRRR